MWNANNGKQWQSDEDICQEDAEGSLQNGQCGLAMEGDQFRLEQAHPRKNPDEQILSPILLSFPVLSQRTEFSHEPVRGPFISISFMVCFTPQIAS